MRESEMETDYLLALIFTIGIVQCALGGNSPLENDGLFEGDIVGIDPMDRNAIVEEAKLWPGGVVYYEVDWRFRGLMDFLDDAIAEYHNKTCIRFRKLTHGVQDYLYLRLGPGCWSSVGRQGGEQELSLADGCHDKPTALHELGHALGLYHEHSRSDRDDYLEILWDNIKEASQHNFMKLRPWENNLLNEKFDYKSVMLYGEYTFAKDRSYMTMRPKQPGVVIGRLNDKPGLSESDVRRINKLYQCFGEVRPPPPEVPPWKCDFEEDMCGMENQFNVRSNWTRAEGTLGGRTGHYIMVRALTSSIRRVRVVTPKFGSYGRKKGCFTFEAYFHGEGVIALDVMIHEADTSKLILKHIEKKDEWIPFSYEFNLEGDVHFSIDANSNKKKGDGVIAIDNLEYKLRGCKE